MKMIDGYVSKDDAERIRNLQCVINGIYVGRAGFTDEDGNDFKTVEPIFTVDEIKNALDTFRDFYMMIAGLEGSRYDKATKILSVEEIAKQRIIVTSKGYQWDDEYGTAIIQCHRDDRKSLYNYVLNDEIRWLKEKVNEEE